MTQFAEPSRVVSWWEDLTEYHEGLEAAAESERPDFRCPLTQEMMRTPAMLCKDGVATHTYEHSAIYKWIVTHGNLTEPLTNEELPPLESNKISIIVNQDKQREIRAWAERKVDEWKAQSRAPLRREPTRQDLHVFVDHSNVLHGATSRTLDIKRLVRFTEGGRNVHERVVIGSHASEATRAEWEAWQYTVAADDRRGREHFVDDALHAQLMRTASKSFDPPRVLALLTGDGNANSGRTTFPECVERALQMGWHVELVSWRSSMNAIYKRFARNYPDQFRVRYLDEM